VQEGSNGQSRPPKKPGRWEAGKRAAARWIDRGDVKITAMGVDTPEEKHVFITLTALVLCSALCHMMQILFFLYIGSALLVAINFVSVCVYVVCGALLVRKKLLAVGVLFSAEITLVGFVMAYLLGTDSYVFAYFYVILLVQMVIPYARWRVRLPIIVAILLFMAASFAIGILLEPVEDISKIKTMYSVFNLSVGANSIMAMVAVNNGVHYMIRQLNKIKLERYMDEAHLDALTGLYNRRYAKMIFDEIAADVEQHNAWCVAMLDIDDFKHINDAYGHDLGDEVLSRLSELIRSSLRKTDYVFRWGGEEFLLLLKNTDVRDSYYTLRKMCVKIQETEMNVKGQTIRLTVTIGLSKCTSGNIELCIKASDQNLYKGKCTGKNVVVM